MATRRKVIQAVESCCGRLFRNTIFISVLNGMVPDEGVQWREQLMVPRPPWMV